MVNKKRNDFDTEDETIEIGEVQNQLITVLEGHQETGEAIQRCVERISKAVDVERSEEALEEVKPIDPIVEKKKELLREMCTIGTGQVARIRRLLKRIEEMNEGTFRSSLAAPMARHELMTLLSVQGLRLPLWVSPVGEHPPPLVGAIGANDAYKLAIGDYCAAYCEDMWILGMVHGIADNGRYEVRDVDDNEKPFTILARRRVIPLPRYRADPERDSHAIFPKNAWILALYPQTTVFYKGIVEHPPKSSIDPYKVAFDDSTFHGGFSPPLEVPQRYVLSFREVAYKPREKGSEKVRELTKEEIREQKEAEKERRRAEKAEEKEREKMRIKGAKKAEKERIKREKKEAKQREKEMQKMERKLERKRLAKERRMKKKQEEKERKEAEANGTGAQEKKDNSEKNNEIVNDNERSKEEREEGAECEDDEEDDVDVEDGEEEEEEEGQEQEEDEQEEDEEEEEEEADEVDDDEEGEEAEAYRTKDCNGSSEDEM